MRKIILNLAMSLDGFIATEDGSFDWISGDGSNTLDTANQWHYGKFLENVDVVVMGKKSYDQGFLEDFKDKQIFVATSQKMEDTDNVRFINGDICEVVLSEKLKDGKDIYLFGGGVLAEPFIKADIIDEYIIGIIPIILGRGRPLFLGQHPAIRLRLVEYIVEEGVAILRYIKRPACMDQVSESRG